MKKILMLVVLSVVSSLSFGAMPHVFQSNTPAKAADVNANFSYLESLVNGNRPISSIVSYSPIDAALGSTVSIAGNTLYLYKAPFYDVRTNTIHHITLLNPNDTPSNFSLVVTEQSADISFNHIRRGKSERVKVNGYSVYIHSSYSQYTRNNVVGSSCYVSIFIEIGSVFIRLYDISDTPYHESTVVQSDFDLTDGFVVPQDDLCDSGYVDADKYIDYLKIEVQP